MKKNLFALVILLLFSSTEFLGYSKTSGENYIYEGAMLKETESTTLPHREVYAFSLSQVNGEGYGICHFYMDDIENLKLLYPFGKHDLFSGFEGIYAGATADGLFYACTYIYKTNSQPPVPGDFISIDLRTGNREIIGEWNPQVDYEFKPQDMTYDYANKIMYAVGFKAGVSTLFNVNLKTAEFTRVCDFSGTVSCIACDYEGNMYAMQVKGTLCSVNKETGELTQIIDPKTGSLLTNQDLEFDHTDNTLYWACLSRHYDPKQQSHWMKFNLENKTVEDMGILGGDNSGSQLQCLYIPFVRGGGEVPDQPTDITITPQGKELKTTIKWKNPTLNFDNKELDNLKSVTIMRDDEIVITIPTTEMGKEMEWTDEHVPTIGNHKYSLYATNAHGEGEKGYVIQYVGEDFPDKVTNVMIAVAEGCMGSTLSWEKPKGAHGCYLDESKIYYKVVRYPDEIVVGDHLKEATATDNSVKRLAQYWYEITAANEIGQTKFTTGSVILGPALNLPFEEAFGNPDQYDNRWMIIDENADNYHWIFNGPMGQQVFGDITPVAEYLIIPGMEGVDPNAANEWLITPPLKMEAGKHYDLTFSYRCVKDETLEVTMGVKNTNNVQERVKSLILEALPIDENEFTECTVPLPSTDGIRCIGFHLTSEYPQDNFAYLQLAYISVHESTGIEHTKFTSQDIRILQTSGAIAIQGEFDIALLYDINGRQISETNEASIATDELSNGIYLLKVIKDNTTKMFKIAVK